MVRRFLPRKNFSSALLSHTGQRKNTKAEHLRLRKSWCKPKAHHLSHQKGLAPGCQRSTRPSWPPHASSTCKLHVPKPHVHVWTRSSARPVNMTHGNWAEIGLLARPQKAIIPRILRVHVGCILQGSSGSSELRFNTCGIRGKSMADELCKCV